MERSSAVDLTAATTCTVAVAFIDLAGLPGWGSDPDPDGADLSSILDRHLGPEALSVRLVRGCTALAVFNDVRAAVVCVMGLLAEAGRSSGSATAGINITDDPATDVAPSSRAGRLAAALADLAEADRLLVTEGVVAALGAADGAGLAFDEASSAEVDAERIATYAVRRR
jgi:hypothetical protein